MTVDQQFDYCRLSVAKGMIRDRQNRPTPRLQSVNIAGAFISIHTEFIAIDTPRISRPWGETIAPRWRENQ